LEAGAQLSDECLSSLQLICPVTLL
jgi:hypothetical protein